MTNLKLLDAYAMLLRHAWLNPTSKEAQDAVRTFEHQNAGRLHPRYKKWQAVNYQAGDDS